MEAIARAAVDRLHAKGIRTVPITGDHAAAGQRVASALGIADVRCEVLPQEKAAIVNALRAEGQVIAISTATDVAMHATGITLMRGDPGPVAGAPVPT